MPGIYERLPKADRSLLLEGIEALINDIQWATKSEKERLENILKTLYASMGTEV